MTTVLYVIGGLLFVSFMLIVLRGAPYVPTRRKDIEALLDLVDPKDGDVLVDLGSGDGRVLEMAAERGVKSVGYELNPLLALWSWLRLRKYKGIARTSVKDFWLTPLPDDTRYVFVFLGTPYMKKLDAKLSREAKRLGRTIDLISYAVPIADKKEAKKHGALLVYRYQA